MYALHQPSKNDWYRIRNQKDGPTQLHIYDEIGYFGVSANDLVRDLADVTGDLEVHINSPGGEVWDGIAIYNALLARKNVTIVIDGIAASIASVVAMAGQPVLMARNAQMMVHDGFTMAIGNAQDLRDLAEQLDKASNNIASIYSEHTGKPLAYWREIMKAETWYDADEAIDAGLADRLVDSGAGRRTPQPVEDKWDLSVFRPNGRQTDAAPRYLNGLPPWDPFGVGDDDSTPEGDRNHDHWSATGKQMKPVPGRPLDSMGRLIDITAVAVDNSPWDPARAIAIASKSDSPEAFFRAICAGEKEDGDPATAAHWALPYRYTPSSAPNATGTKKAMARFPEIQGSLVQESGTRNRLSEAMKLIDPDWSPGNDPDILMDFTDDQITAFAKSLRL